MELETWKQHWSDLLNDDNLNRVQHFVEMIPSNASSVLEVGARTGLMTSLMSEYHSSITALDLTRPTMELPGVTTVAGDATNLDFPDNTFDAVVCSQVLEHIPAHLLTKACSEMSRVAKKYVVIGVPYKQDTRAGRLTCHNCGTKNPPYGHVNSFNQRELKKYFPTLSAIKTETLGPSTRRTNFLSTMLMDLADNPYGTYEQLEECIRCGNNMSSPAHTETTKRIAARTADIINSIQNRVFPGDRWWVHILFKKP